MNKKLLAVAVSGALAAPGVALAQVTISGLFKGGVEGISIGSTSKNPSSQVGVVDDSSRIIFGVKEDLGGGLTAIAQFDQRWAIDTGAGGATGNTHVGLQSKNWGKIIIGRQDLHYFNNESNISDKGSLRVSPNAILAYASSGDNAIAAASRTQNVVHYTTPNWNGFTVIAAHSFNPNAAEADINTGGARKGNAWNLNPNYAGKGFQVGYSYWNAKPDGSSGVNERGDRLYGSVTVAGGFKVGLAYDKSKRATYAAGATTNESDRTAWSLPVSYTTGPHSIHAHYTKARDDKIIAGDQSAKMFGLGYAYDLSKRTSVALTYAKITNSTDALYNLFGSSLGVGGASAATTSGEDPKLWGVTLRHAF